MWYTATPILNFYDPLNRYLTFLSMPLWYYVLSIPIFGVWAPVELKTLSVIESSLGIPLIDCKEV